LLQASGTDAKHAGYTMIPEWRHAVNTRRLDALYNALVWWCAEARISTRHGDAEAV